MSTNDTVTQTPQNANNNRFENDSHSQFDVIAFYEDILSKLDAETIYDKFPHNLKFDGSGKGRGEPPFNDSKSGTSFTVFPDLGFYDANANFGSNPVTYVHSMNVGHYEKPKGKDWIEALKELANLAGETLPEKTYSTDQIAKWEKLQRRRNLLSALYDICQEKLWSSVGEKALAYLRDRGYSQDCDEGLKRFQIGFFDDAKAIHKQLIDRGFTQVEIKEVLGSGKTFSKWEGYITYPWYDANNQPLTLYGRYQEKTPPEGYDKTLALHGKQTKRSPYLFHECLENRQKEIIFVEGINDALFLQIKGDKRVCAGVAAQFSKEQWETLKRKGVNKVIHAGDPDSGGDNGTKSNVINGISRGLDVYVSQRLPDGYDPDEYVDEFGVEAWENYTSSRSSQHGMTWLGDFACKRPVRDDDGKITHYEYLDFAVIDQDKITAYSQAKELIGKIPNLDAVMIDMFWKSVAKTMDISDKYIAHLEASFGKNPTSDIPANFKAVDISKWLIDKYRTTIAWDASIGEWRRYEAIRNGVWTVENEIFVWGFVWNEIEKLVEVFDKAEITPKIVDETLKFLKSGLSIRQFDSQGRTKIPFNNGVLDLQSNIFENHAPGYRFTWALPYDYDPNATCDPIKDWMLEAFEGDRDMVELIRAYLYGIVAGRTDWQKYVEMIGAGGTGKSTIIRLAESLVGRENVHSTTLKKLEESRFETASIKDKRLVVVTDSERYAGGVSVLKALTGQDSLPYEIKMKQSTGGFIPESMVLIAGNETIKSSDYTSGLERRRINVPMNHRIPSNKQRQLIEFDQNGSPVGEFSPYIAGLFNWVLGIGAEKATAFVKHYESLVPSLVRRKLETLLETNPMADWANEKLVYRPSEFTAVGTKESGDGGLYGSYCNYCLQVNIQPVSQKRFTGLLEDLFKNQLGYTNVYHKRKKNGRGFVGLAIRSWGDNDPPVIFDDGDGSVTEGDGSVTDKVTAESPAVAVSKGNGDGCDGLNQKQNHSENKNKNNNPLEPDGTIQNNASYPSPDSQNQEVEPDLTRHPSRHPSVTTNHQPVTPYWEEKGYWGKRRKEARHIDDITLEVLELLESKKANGLVNGVSEEEVLARVAVTKQEWQQIQNQNPEIKVGVTAQGETKVYMISQD